MGQLSLVSLLRFTTLLNKLRDIERVMYIPGTKEKENDVEHSYHLAMLSWYIASTAHLDLNRDKLLMYALIHDIVEVYAGDTYLYSDDQELHDSKVERENDARIKIQMEFPEFTELNDAIISYEKKEDEESRFIYALDKIHPVLQVYLDEGKIWKEMNITLSMLLEKKNKKIALSPYLIPYWEEFIIILKEKEQHLFPGKQS